jgi:uncharacterized protein YgfB (UPF0149 family)
LQGNSKDWKAMLVRYYNETAGYPHKEISENKRN